MLNEIRSKLRLRTRFLKLKKAATALYKLLRYEPALSLKYGPPFLHSFNSKQLSVMDEFPIISLKAVKFLDDLLQPTSAVFEYGAGGTTSFISKRCGRHVFVENVPGYFEAVVRILKEKGRSNIEPMLIEPRPLQADETPQPHPEHPWVTYLSSNKNYEHLDFTDYVKAIDQYPDQIFDLVVIDGRARVSCIIHAIPKVKQGGYIMLDDSNRDMYKVGFEYLEAHFEGIHLKGLRAYHTMIHQASATNQQTSFWRIR